MQRSWTAPFFPLQVPLDEILSPKISQDDHAPPPTKRGRLSADVGRKGLTLVPNHPDILPLAPGWKLGKGSPTGKYLERGEGEGRGVGCLKSAKIDFELVPCTPMVYTFSPI